MLKLQSRISELHAEIDTAKEDFRLLHKERTLLTKERENQEKDIQIWSARCRDLQMLKFGKLVDLGMNNMYMIVIVVVTYGYNYSFSYQ